MKKKMPVKKKTPVKKANIDARLERLYETSANLALSLHQLVGALVDERQTRVQVQPTEHEKEESEKFLNELAASVGTPDANEKSVAELTEGQLRAAADELDSHSAYWTREWLESAY